MSQLYIIKLQLEDWVYMSCWSWGGYGSFAHPKPSTDKGSKNRSPKTSRRCWTGSEPFPPYKQQVFSLLFKTRSQEQGSNLIPMDSSISLSPPALQQLQYNWLLCTTSTPSCLPSGILFHNSSQKDQCSVYDQVRITCQGFVYYINTGVFIFHRVGATS